METDFNTLESKPIIFFDGVCNLCQSSVQFVIKRDKKSHFQFSSLQSPFAKEFLNKFNVSPDDLNTVILFSKGKIYKKSSAAIRILSGIGHLYSLSILLLVVPRFIRDYFYAYIALNRYKWFGKRQECWIPTPELKARFLNDIA